jgi:hypothetical protein
MAADLVWFSPNSFYFAGEWMRKASLDALIFGDTGCGKSKIAERLADFYEVGEIISGENISFMNLVGGIKTLHNYRGVAWGRLAQAHRGVMVIDELSALDVRDISRLTSLRSEAKANAVTGLLWLSNTREGRRLAKYSYGTDALCSLIGAGEDIRRFDYAHAVSDDEVDQALINQNGDVEECKFGPLDSHNLILWVKSRMPNQISFTDAAVKAIFRKSAQLAATYVSDVELITSSTAKIKLAKISAAIAGRIFSTDTTGEILRVDERCVTCAMKFLETLYRRDNMGYYSFSQQEKRYRKLDEEQAEKQIKGACHDAGTDVNSFMNLLLHYNTITRSDLFDWLGQDNWQTRNFIRSMLHMGAFKSINNYYVKRDNFIKFLRRKVGQKNV